MGRTFYLPFIAFVLIGLNTLAQTGEIKGKVTEKGGKEGVPFASVAALMNGTQIQATVTDFDGNYSIKPLSPGKYDVKATCVGYQPQEYKGVLVTAEKISFVNLELGKGIELSTIEIVEYTVPLIDKGSPATQKTVTYEEIQAAPTRDVNSLVSQTAGVYQADEGKDINIRGSRSDATAYYVDGIKVRGNVGLPQKGTEQITVITGGVPAQYGDATGGIVSITTRGPSKIYTGGIEVASSQLFDKYNYNLGSFDISGPIWTDRDSLGKKSGQPVAGFFLAGEYQYDKDPSPSAIPTYVVKDDILNNLRKNPVVRSPSGFNYISRSSYFTQDSLTPSKARPNVASKAIRLNGKLDFRPVKNVTFTFGGSYERSDVHNYIDIYSLMNYDNNPQTIESTWRVFGKVTQRFTSEESEKKSSAIKNAYYSVQVDYSNNHSVTQNDVHKDRIFDYGYVGKFNRFYRPTYDTNVLQAAGGGDSIVQYEHDIQDTLVTFVPGTQNPYTANYTQQYFDLTRPFGTSIYQDNLGDIANLGGLLNDDNRTTLNVYGLWATPGRVRSLYSISDQNQIRVTASASADIKNHNIVAGFEYEQRTDRGYAVSPSSLWNLMRQLSNLQLKGWDSTSAVTSTDYIGSTPITTINFDRANYQASRNVNGVVAPGFFENVRTALGIPMYDSVQTDALDPSFFNIGMFTPDELLSGGQVAYYGYDYKGKVQNSSPSLNDYYTQVDATHNFTRKVDAFRPNYFAGYIQDKFSFNDLIFNVGVRIDRFDANQYTLKDKYLLFDSYTAGDAQARALGAIPSSIPNDYVVYVNDAKNPTQIVGFRKEDKWYDTQGNPITDLKNLTQTGGGSSGIQPYVKNYSEVQNSYVNPVIFKRYDPQVNVMPRIAFSFPISDEAYFAAHYDILTQRPQDLSLIRFNPATYTNLAQGLSANVTNPDLKPERTTDYEVTFQQKLSRSSALSISAFYKELRDNIEYINVQYAYPITYSTYGNIDFGTVKGLTFGYDLRRTNNIRMNVSYTLQFADGTGSDPAANAGILAQQGQTNLRTPKPLDFDQRHTFVASVDYHYGTGKDYNGPVWGNKQIFADAGLNLVFRAGSGTPYTRKSNVTPEADFTTSANTRSTIDGTINGSRLPWQFKVDARVDKNFEIKTGKKADGEARRPLFATVYFQILNVFDAKNILAVYKATGSPSDDGYLAAPQAQTSIASQVSPEAYRALYSVAENNPGNYSLPRRIRLGIQLNF